MNDDASLSHDRVVDKNENSSFPISRNLVAGSRDSSALPRRAHARCWPLPTNTLHRNAEIRAALRMHHLRAHRVESRDSAFFCDYTRTHSRTQ